jgi:hypothetical protein
MHEQKMMMILPSFLRRIRAATTIHARFTGTTTAFCHHSIDRLRRTTAGDRRRRPLALSPREREREREVREEEIVATDCVKQMAAYISRRGDEMPPNPVGYPTRCLGPCARRPFPIRPPRHAHDLIVSTSQRGLIKLSNLSCDGLTCLLISHQQRNRKSLPFLNLNGLGSAFIC